MDMGNFDSDVLVKKQLVLFLVIDTSRSMDGTKIGAVNTAIREVLNDSEFQKAGGSDADILVAPLSFSNGCEWLRNQPVPVEELSKTWVDLKTEGCTDLGAACRELAKKLDKKEFLNAPGGLAAPVILLMSDGGPTDNFDDGLAELKANKYYKQTIRFACAIGADADRGVLAKFCDGNEKEVVLSVNTPEALRKWIRVVSLKSVKEGSGPQKVVDGASISAQDAAVKEVKQAIENDSTLNKAEQEDEEWE